VNEPALNLERFLTAQAPVMAPVMAELQAGHKQSHWMWFIFPQLAALGRSATAKFYGLQNLAEAQTYLAHPVLAHAGKKTAHEIFGAPDDLKFRSCMTLFLLAAPQIDVFRSALDTFYGGEADEHTVRLVGADR